jgi:hypothetical protein
VGGQLERSHGGMDVVDRGCNRVQMSRLAALLLRQSTFE